MSRGQNVLLIVHRGDAVKNFTTDFEQYNVLSPQFKSLSYHQKANILRTKNNPYDLKSWSRQQWPYNTLKYGQRFHVIYIQADWIYCYFPSIFAEAMCGDLYNRSEDIDNLTFYFEGPGQELYNVGDYDIAQYLLQVMNNLGTKVPMVIDLPGDIEWMRFSDEFLDSFYQLVFTGDYSYVQTWLRFPWEVIVNNLDRQIRPVEILIKPLANKPVLVTATYISDLDQKNPYLYPSASYIVNSSSGRFKVYNESLSLPLSLIVPNPDEVSIFYFALNLANSPVANYVNHDSLTFVGTVKNPAIIFDDGRIIPTTQMKRIIDSTVILH